MDIKMEDSVNIKVEDTMNIEAEDSMSIKTEDVDMKIDDIVGIKVEDIVGTKISDASSEDNSREETSETNTQRPIVIDDNDSEENEVESSEDQEACTENLPGFKLPDVNHPDNYCESCLCRYKSKIGFKNHLHDYHRIDTNINSTAGQPFDCNLCGVGFAERLEYQFHLKNIHRLRRKLFKPNPNISPDPKDPNFYCRSCRKQFGIPSKYRSHLISIHHIVKDLPHVRKRRRLVKNPDVEPGINDLNHYCRKCDRTYKDRKNYRKHLCMNPSGLRGWRAKPAPGTEPDINDPNNYCRSCNFVYATRSSYAVHLMGQHKIDHGLLYPRLAPRPEPTTPGAEPDINDPNNYCRSCNFTFSSRRTYIAHLKSKHPNLDIPRPRRAIPTPGIEPDISDPNFHCRSCNITYASRRAYVTHLKSIHKVHPDLVQPLRYRTVPTPGVDPDINDPNNYCRSCNYTFSSRRAYKGHLKSKHPDLINSNPHRAIPTPGVEPDIPTTTAVHVTLPIHLVQGT